jgi:8-amino-7-oxononanoate synthase
MEGDTAPLKALRDVARRAGALVYVDDAHGAFASGSHGRGTPEVQGLAHHDFLYIGTLGKALGCQGGFVIGPAALIEWLRNRARPFIYSTAMAPPVAGAALAALELVGTQPRLRTRLAQAAARLHRGLAHRASQHSYIVPVMLGSAARALAVSQRLWERGHFAPAIRPPTVPAGTARLRLSLSALHTSRQIDDVCEALSEA